VKGKGSQIGNVCWMSRFDQIMDDPSRRYHLRSSAPRSSDEVSRGRPLQGLEIQKAGLTNERPSILAYLTIHIYPTSSLFRPTPIRGYVSLEYLSQLVTHSVSPWRQCISSACYSIRRIYPRLLMNSEIETLNTALCDGHHIIFKTCLTALAPLLSPWIR
jgi:hypothetical protein